MKRASLWILAAALSALVFAACAGADGDPAPIGVDAGPGVAAACDDAGAHE